MKKFNAQTKGYKVDIYVRGMYYKSTDMYKTCKAAKARFLELHPDVSRDEVKCLYGY